MNITEIDRLNALEGTTEKIAAEADRSYEQGKISAAEIFRLKAWEK